jgi:UDP-N-acetylglucosamine acyltransferase
MIHPTAIVSPQAQLDSSVEVGPYAVIDEGVSLAAGCVIGPHAYLTGLTEIGRGNRFHAGCVIGDAPQDLKYDGTPTRLRIGERNVFREHVTIHRSTNPTEATIIGNGNLLMANSHVGHNSHLGDNIIIANGALLGGHVRVFDRAFISGNCLVHQFVRVGTLSLMQGGAAISKDLPPFTIVRYVNELCGLNSVGLRRAGLTAEERLELKRLYRSVFRGGKNLRPAIQEASALRSSKPSQLLLEFIAESKRGVCMHHGAAIDDAD